MQREINAHNAQPDRAYRLSASIGGAAYDPRKPEQVEALLARADALMYEQKRLRQARGQSLPAAQRLVCGHSANHKTSRNSRGFSRGPITTRVATSPLPFSSRTFTGPKLVRIFGAAA